MLIEVLVGMDQNVLRSRPQGQAPAKTITRQPEFPRPRESGTTRPGNGFPSEIQHLDHHVRGVKIFYNNALKKARTVALRGFGPGSAGFHPASAAA
ncbi:MAG: hypothetical protein AUK55_03560 [Syntrophobacteraceae bacterium CG2_30_61_12]|nr:MAG: hypothetical protein AUK55_03560 [Syntrophobacteraceae bacterium CG2_30_61_12]PIU31449.1 MAG: hypothetical protein COT06_08100 [Syntrophobacteraceae bacterium CG07_land_8_20_14_0_80_61_8]